MSVFKSCCFATAALIAQVEGAKWTYNDLGNDWAGLSPDWAICDSGLQQSPIDISASNTHLSAGLTFTRKNNYFSGSIAMIDKGYTVQANFPGGIAGGNGDFTRSFFDGTPGDFKALQMHVHAPSEHTVNGYAFDLELHLVHLFADGSLGGVIGVFFDRRHGGNVQNPLVQSMISPEPTEKPGNARNVDVEKFLSGIDFTKFFAYPGSLTTPPCTEGVKWNVMQEVQSLSQAQYEWFAKQWHANPDFFGNGNYRRTQPLNGRIVQASKTPEDWPKLTVYTSAQMMSVAATTLAALTLTSF